MFDQRFRCGKELAIVKYRFKESILHFFSRWYLQLHTIKWRILSKFNKNNTHINENDRIRLKHQNICKTKKRNLIWQILFLMLGFIHSVGFHASLNTRQTVLRDRFFYCILFCIHQPIFYIFNHDSCYLIIAEIPPSRLAKDLDYKSTCFYLAYFQAIFQKVSENLYLPSTKHLETYLKLLISCFNCP